MVHVGLPKVRYLTLDPDATSTGLATDHLCVWDTASVHVHDFVFGKSCWTDHDHDEK